jgi:hypothetical protein
MTESESIIEFTVDPTFIQPGGCATFRWRVEGVKAVYFYPEGQRWQDHGVVGMGERQVCPPQPATYCLRVVKSDDSVEVRQLTVQMQGQSGVVQMFAVDRDEIRAGECVKFRWHVEGVKAVYFHAEGNEWETRGVVGVAEAERCPSKTRTFCLRVVKRDDSVEIHRITVRVKE